MIWIDATIAPTLVGRKTGQTRLDYLYNGHGDVTKILSNNSAVMGSYYYDAFGNILEESGSADNSYKYAGYQHDEESGLYYLNARFYDPEIARFVQEDTYRGNTADPLSLNLYTYCVNNPVRYYDPSGHASQPIGNDGIYRGIYDQTYFWNGMAYDYVPEGMPECYVNPYTCNDITHLHKFIELEMTVGETLEIDVGLIHDIDATELTEIRDAGAIWITDSSGEKRVVEPQAVYESYGAGVGGGELTDEQLDILWRTNKTLYNKIAYGNQMQFLPAPNFGDNVSMQLRALINYYDKKGFDGWINDDNKDYVEVHFMNKTKRYYYDIKKYGQTHGNYMREGKMYVNAAEFGKYFGLVYPTEHEWESANIFVAGELDWNFSVVGFASQRIEAKIFIHYFNTHLGRVIVKQGFEIKTGEFTGSDELFPDGPSLWFDTKMKYETENGILVDSVQLREQIYENGKSYRYHVRYSNREDEYSLINYYNGNKNEIIIAIFGFTVFANFGIGSKRIGQKI